MNHVNEPIRIAQIMGKMMSGGVESVVMNYYRHIDRTKVQFDFIIDDDSTIVPYDEIIGLGGRIHRVPPYQNPIAYHEVLVELFSQNQYHIVHSHINTMSIFPLFAAKRAGVPIRIAHSHSTAGKGETAKNIMKYVLRPFSKVFPTHFCACSELAGRWLFGGKLYDSGRVNLIRNAIDISKFTFDVSIRDTMRDELGLEDNFVVGHVGRFMKQKNHSFLIDIFDRVHNQKSNAILLLVGEGELEQEVRDKVKKLGLTDCVRFLGVRNDVHRILQAMDVFLLPSLYEGLGMVAVEAQAVGLPVIASDMVPMEAKITEYLTYVSLGNSAEKWAEKVLTVQVNERKTEAEIIVGAGYEIGSAARDMLGYYQSFGRKKQNQTEG